MDPYAPRDTDAFWQAQARIRTLHLDVARLSTRGLDRAAIATTLGTSLFRVARLCRPDGSLR